jgi:hypothetical protein
VCFEDFYSNDGQIRIYYVSEISLKNLECNKIEFTLNIRFWECYSCIKYFIKSFLEIIFN